MKKSHQWSTREEKEKRRRQKELANSVRRQRQRQHLSVLTRGRTLSRASSKAVTPRAFSKAAKSLPTPCRRPSGAVKCLREFCCLLARSNPSNTLVSPRESSSLDKFPPRSFLSRAFSRAVCEGGKENEVRRIPRL